jgi:hypothetical protein
LRVRNLRLQPGVQLFCKDRSFTGLVPRI